jgi:Ca2+-binding RTX toxin-like protein
MATIIGTPNSETLTGTEFADSILGAGGNDTVNGLAGADTLDGGADNDTLRGGDGNDSLLGGTGKDWLFGDAGDDRLFGGDRLDRLTGGDGNDVLDGGTGDDRLVGGKGNDIYVVDNLQDQTTELTGEGTDEVRTSLLSFALGGFIENLSFTGTGNFAGTGNGGANRIVGGSGNDVLDGAAGNDLLRGGSGRDTLAGADGNDVLDGGTGRDALSGGSRDDTLFGRDFNDVLTGGVGNDVVDGGLGTDTARFSGLKSDYQIRRIDDTIEVVDLNTADGDDGTDLLSGVEVLQFKDGALAPPTAIAAIDLTALNGTNGFSFSGGNGAIIGAQSGLSVSEAGDVNGDGFDDVIIGAPGYTSSGPGGEDYYTHGRSYVVFGKGSWAGTPSLEQWSIDGSNGFILSGKDLNSRIGYSVSTAGDVNGDGFADLIVGAPGQYIPYDDGNQTGQAYVVFGKANWTGAPDLDLATLDGNNGFKLTHPDAYGFAGFSVSSAGDVNDDGLDDLIVGAPYAHGTGGASYVVFGKADWAGTPALDLTALNGTNGFRLGGIDLNDHAGASVSEAGDVNGDGVDDLIIGASSAVEAYIVFGKSSWAGAPSLELETLDGSNGFRITGESGSLTGRSVHTAGDVNGDGIADIIVGAPGFGESYVIFGKTDWTGTPALDVATLDGSDGFRLIGDPPSDSGFSVSSAGDVNGDGYDDLIIGAPEVLSGGYGGGAFVVYGKANWAETPSLDLAELDGTNGFELIGLDWSTGFSVSSAGDVNSDGFDDLVVGSPAEDGVSFVVFGGNFNNATVQAGAHAQLTELETIISSG